ncbi:MAG: enoyl-CoA hydratase/isomerase family protein [Beijerinckiaceae bacterium]
MSVEPEIICEKRGAAGVVTLNRPHALNALTHGMVRVLAPALAAWSSDPSVTRIIVEGAGDRAFCAGGDIRALYEAGSRGDHAGPLAFWRDEYSLNAFIARYPKPYVALIDGIVMGGGVGLSLHGSHRVAGDRYLFAMPEVGIGFFPDVGATYALPRLPGRTGIWLALTGDRVKAADALALGLANHRVPSARMADLRSALIDGEDVDAALVAHDAPRDGALPSIERATIQDCFSGHSVNDILARLDAFRTPFAAKAAATIRTKSPTSLKVAFEQMRRGGSLSFAEAMETEYRIVSRIVRGHDFYEGVRAVIVDKDNAPRWSPPDLDAVDDDVVAEHFNSLGADEWRVET